MSRRDIRALFARIECSGREAFEHGCTWHRYPNRWDYLRELSLVVYQSTTRMLAQLTELTQLQVLGIEFSNDCQEAADRRGDMLTVKLPSLLHLRHLRVTCIPLHLHQTHENSFH